LREFEAERGPAKVALRTLKTRVEWLPDDGHYHLDA
jgi:hypothetical protein